MKIVHTNIIHYPVFPRILYREVIMINMRQSKRRHHFYMLILVTCNACIISFHNTSNSIIKSLGKYFFNYWCRDQDPLTPKLIPLVRRATVFRRVSPVLGSVIIFLTNAGKYMYQQIQLMA